MNHKNECIDFLKWVYGFGMRNETGISIFPKAIAQQPTFEHFIILNHKGDNAYRTGKFFNHDELYDLYYRELHKIPLIDHIYIGRKKYDVYYRDYILFNGHGYLFCTSRGDVVHKKFFSIIEMNKRDFMKIPIENMAFECYYSKSSHKECIKYFF